MRIITPRLDVSDNEALEQDILDREKFFAYYKSSTYGVAIEVGQLRKLKRYLFLPELGHKINPPQSYQYLDRKVFEQLV